MEPNLDRAALVCERPFARARHRQVVAVSAKPAETVDGESQRQAEGAQANSTELAQPKEGLGPLDPWWAYGRPAAAAKRLRRPCTRLPCLPTPRLTQGAVTGRGRKIT